MMRGIAEKGIIRAFRITAALHPYCVHPFACVFWHGLPGHSPRLVFAKVKAGRLHACQGAAVNWLEKRIEYGLAELGFSEDVHGVDGVKIVAGWNVTSI